MEILVTFFRENHNLYIYFLFIVFILIFAFIARIFNHFIALLSRRNSFIREDVIETFTPFLIILFIIASESLFLLLFSMPQYVENSFSFFLNTQIIWASFWLVVTILKFAIYEIPVSRINLRRFYPTLRILFLVILLVITATRNLEHIIALLLGFGVTMLLLHIAFTLNQIPIVWARKGEEEKIEKIIGRWDTFNITLPYNIPKEIINKAIQLAQKCVRESDNVGKNFSVLLKDLSERGIVIEVKYLTLNSAKMKETKHSILSSTLKAFAEQHIPMSST